MQEETNKGRGAEKTDPLPWTVRTLRLVDIFKVESGKLLGE
jgi:hypothetical protein